MLNDLNHENLNDPFMKYTLNRSNDPIDCKIDLIIKVLMTILKSNS